MLLSKQAAGFYGKLTYSRVTRSSIYISLNEYYSTKKYITQVTVVFFKFVAISLLGKSITIN